MSYALVPRWLAHPAKLAHFSWFARDFCLDLHVIRAFAPTLVSKSYAQGSAAATRSGELVVLAALVPFFSK